MKAVIDTNSLLSLARYYLPNDKKEKLKEALKKKLISGELIILDEVLKESRFLSSGLIVKELDYLGEREFLKNFNVGENTEYLIPNSPQKFYKQVDNNFAIRGITGKLNEEEYESVKNTFLNSADCKMIIKCGNLKKEGEEVVLVTEESKLTNDRKPFKKIPLICEFLEIKTWNIQEYLDSLDDVRIIID